jgi:hypothetical protein
VKHINIISAIVLVASFYSFAGIDLRIGGGLNLSNETYSGDYKLPAALKKSMHVGFNAGASVAIHFSSQMGMVGGLSYETRGAEMDLDAAASGASAYDPRYMPWVYSMGYLQIPVHFSYWPIPALGIALGPELGIFTNGKSKTGSESGDLQIKTIDLGASLTVDYTFANILAVGAGYYFGFLNNDGSPAADVNKGGIRNNNIKLFAAYVLHL